MPDGWVRSACHAALMHGNMVASLLEAREAELTAKLAQARAGLSHAGNRGDASETAVRMFLTAHLSRSYDVGQGEVIDTQGHRTRQMDVVISTTDHPFRQPAHEPGLYVVEGVFALGEVKAGLTTAEVDDIVAKGHSLRKLAKAHLAGSEVFSNPSDHRRWVEGPPPFFAFAFESSVAVQTLVDRLHAAGDVLDAVFVLGRGSAINYGDGRGTARLRMVDGGDVAGWAWTEGRPTLLSLLGWLHALPRVRHRQSPFLEYLAQTPSDGSVQVVLPAP